MTVDQRADFSGTIQECARPVGGAVLLIDDDTAFVQKVKCRLRENLWVCRVAENYTRALWECFYGDDISAVVLSLQEGDFEPAELIDYLTFIRANLILVGTGAQSDRERFAALGVHRFLTKPWSSTDLLRLLVNRQDQRRESIT